MQFSLMTLGLMTFAAAPALADFRSESPDCAFFSEQNTGGAYWTSQVDGKDPQVGALTSWWNARARSVWVKNGFRFTAFDTAGFQGSDVVLDGASANGTGDGTGVSFNLSDFNFDRKLMSYTCRAVPQNGPDFRTESPNCALFSDQSLGGTYWTSIVDGAGMKDPKVAALTWWWKGRTRSVWVQDGYQIKLYSQENYQGDSVTIARGLVVGLDDSKGLAVNLDTVNFATRPLSFSCEHYTPADFRNEQPDCAIFSELHASYQAGSYWTALANGKDQQVPAMTDWWKDRARSVWVRNGFLFQGYNRENYIGDSVELGAGYATGSADSGGLWFDLPDQGFDQELQSFTCSVNTGGIGS